MFKEPIYRFFKKTQGRLNYIYLPKFVVEKFGNQYYMEVYEDKIILLPYPRGTKQKQSKQEDIMDSIDIISLLASDNYIIFNKEIAKEYGIEVAIIIGELASEYKYYQKNNQLIEEYFYSTIENVENNTTLSRYQQDKALNKLKELNLIDVKVKGIPPKRYVKFNLQIFTNQFVKNLQIKMQKTNKLNCKKLTTNNNNINNNNNNNNNIESEAIYTIQEFQYLGVIEWNNWKWTYYLMSEFPGSTSTPVQGRHVNDKGFVCDNEGYIILASVDLEPYTIVDTPFGYKGKVYDTGCPSGILDVYTNW